MVKGAVGKLCDDWRGLLLVSINEQEGVKVLEEIVKSSGIHLLTAETTLSTWKKRKLEVLSDSKFGEGIGLVEKSRWKWSLAFVQY